MELNSGPFWQPLSRCEDNADAKHWEKIIVRDAVAKLRKLIWPLERSFGQCKFFGASPGDTTIIWLHRLIGFGVAEDAGLVDVTIHLEEDVFAVKEKMDRVTVENEVVLAFSTEICKLRKTIGTIAGSVQWRLVRSRPRETLERFRRLLQCRTLENSR